MIGKKGGMETKQELNQYVMRWHANLMTDVERGAQRHLFATLKATMGRSDISAQQEARGSAHSRLLSDDPEVLRLASEGYDSFVQRTASRILQDCGARLSFNRCPDCGGLARTPTARQCRFCGYDWHT